jgi:hypothetical protein
MCTLNIILFNQPGKQTVASVGEGGNEACPAAGRESAKHHETR